MAHASTITAGPLGRTLGAILAQTEFANDLDVFNYALTLEHLEYAFYRDGLERFSVDDFADAGFDEQVYEYFGLIRDHEGDHVDVIAETIAGAGGEPVEEAEYDFGYDDVAGFVATAAVLENVGVSAYTGAAASIADPNLLTAALTIHGVEARHASYLNELTDVSPFPAAFETALSPDEVLAAAGPFIVSDDMAEAPADDAPASGDDDAVGGGDMETVATMPSTGTPSRIFPALHDRW